ITLHENPTTTISPIFSIDEQKNNSLTVTINNGYKSNDVLKHFINNNNTIESFNEILPGLNEIFISLVEGTKATTREFQTVA
ncbi:MAG: DUF4162 domain-containing protein, partial [Chitinophagaceae bacterium]|nr:DUF4162 domain-containing protein [Chitinophagaceae bacterium]